MTAKSFINHHLARIASSILVAAFAVAALPAIASAQVAPGEQIQGTIQSINGTWNITVLDANGYLDNVGLHQGTIINPTGLTLAPGMSVTILGYTDGNVFEANEIDTPYQYAGPLPTPVYYGPGWWYPGFAYGYGPSFSLSLNFGGGGWVVARQPWVGHWWVSTPVRGFAGYRYPAARTGYVAPRAYVTHPAYAPARPAYSAPNYRTYARPQAGAQFRGGYSAPASHYSAPASHYSAPASHYSGGRSYAGSRGSSRNGDRR